MPGDQSIFSKLQVAPNPFGLLKKFNEDRFPGKIDLNVGGEYIHVNVNAIKIYIQKLIHVLKLQPLSYTSSISLG